MPYRLKIKMMNLRKLSVLANAALLVTGISGVSVIAGTARAATTATSLPTTSLTDLITSLINSVGDDKFSTIDLTTLVTSLTLTASTPLRLSTSAAPAQTYRITMTPPSSSGTSTTHYGPFASGSPDSGTCGNNWADDTFDRHFTVFQNRDDGSLLVVEQFKDGSFVTTTGSSPGACQNGPPTATVAGGIQGSFHGYEVIPLPAGTTQNSNSPYCDATNPTDLDC